MSSVYIEQVENGFILTKEDGPSFVVTNLCEFGASSMGEAIRSLFSIPPACEKLMTIKVRNENKSFDGVP